MKHGTYAGAVRDVATLRERCVIDGDCWHIRTPSGRKMPVDGMKIYVHGKGNQPVARAAWELAHGKPMPKNRIGTRTCDSADCANPAHIKAYSAQERGDLWRKKGTSFSVKKVIAAKLTAAARSRLTPELRRWIIESPQTGPALAHALDHCTSHINTIRAVARHLA